MAEDNKPDGTNIPPFETEDLRTNLAKFLDSTIDDPVAGTKRPVGNFRWGVYIFYDYDGEPIYVGQTNERLRSRIRRHLTNSEPTQWQCQYLTRSRSSRSRSIRWRS
ncbi:GIY-YIG nuclease family protein [Rhizobium leguminosarum]|uniref:GIY-YIG nuclease family protein n=1 Tax=Rhizobium leguminosarum TaxID=384 RepID=UPI003F9BD087